MSEISTAIGREFYAVNLAVNNVPALRAFYERWGWTAKPYSSDEYAAFELNGTIVAFVQKDVLAAEASPDEPIAAGGWNGVNLALRVSTREAVDAAWRAAVDANARPVTQPADRPWGGRTSFVADPEGNRWEIVWVPEALLNA